ncbi:Uncharacterized protein FWK35_00036956, partial [Aphis craccivora]
VCSFIRACDYAIEAVDKDSIPLLVKFINSRITGKALETLQIGLNSVRMKNDEDVLTYTGRVEQLYYNLCNATLANKTPEEARILRKKNVQIEDDLNVRYGRAVVIREGYKNSENNFADSISAENIPADSILAD